MTKSPAALGHREHLALVDEVDELEERHLDRVGVAAQRRHRRLELAHVGVVVGADGHQLAVEPRSRFSSR